ncbi:glutathionylspermidine synthase family protein [Acetobacter persici]|uniref:glutathionylspermidine synthase family protein n=1 Tax=Acetobacter persici TaxID=1076596 RepID=UPI001BAC62F6|nr:glutathionylspermidine synthase family protein [Acetobacter persici]MBS0961545.1 glutathionylspermidine synthase family protein [Acetobacter persici]
MPHIRRVPATARQDWKTQADQIGYGYYRNEDGSEAWRESVRYELDHSALTLIRHTAQTLHQMCLSLVEDILRQPDGLDTFHIPRSMQDVVRKSWRRQDPFLIGRFDLAWCGGQPRLIEYNADTPATVPESTRMQTLWHQHCGKPHDHAPLEAERLVAYLTTLRQAGRISPTIHIVPYPDNLEDATHALYYSQWAQQAGLTAVVCDLKDLEVSTGGELLYQGRIIRTMLRMYPWELMFRDPGARHLHTCHCTFLNPPWTALLSNKALLPALWERHPGHPNLLAAGYSPEDVTRHSSAAYVEKPIHARGGENVRMMRGTKTLYAEAGTYNAYPKIYQDFADHRINGVTASIGAWMIGDQFSGLTMRESATPVVSHTSAIVPHIVYRKRKLSYYLEKFLQPSPRTVTGR